MGVSQAYEDTDQPVLAIVVYRRCSGRSAGEIEFLPDPREDAPENSRNVPFA
ncbi:hypothetical protein [Rhodococcus sp. P14]|uniref:hypothetical protein n=1 Tax=Rhodococcus sp. P14 TaxID=450821 RepID=UPI0012F6CBBC|nr:hypothetical protein [Rhodococcus sp. P14]